MKIDRQLPSAFARLGNHEEYDWTPLPWKGIYNKVLFCDGVTGATIELAKIEKGAEFPAHYHPSVQTLFLVEGHLKSGDQEITKGTFNVIPAGELHGPFFALEDSIQFKYFSASPVYLLRDGTSVFYKEDGNTFTSDAMKAGALQKDNYLK